MALIPPSPLDPLYAVKLVEYQKAVALQSTQQMQAAAAQTSAQKAAYDLAQYQKAAQQSADAQAAFNMAQIAAATAGKVASQIIHGPAPVVYTADIVPGVSPLGGMGIALGVGIAGLLLWRVLARRRKG